MSVFDERVDIFLSAWRSEITRGLPWIQSAILSGSALLKSVYGVFLYLAIKYFPAFAEL